MQSPQGAKEKLMVRSGVNLKTWLSLAWCCDRLPRSLWGNGLYVRIHTRPCPWSDTKYFHIILGGVLILQILWIRVFVTHQTSFCTSLSNLGLHTNRNSFTSKDNALVFYSVSSLFFFFSSCVSKKIFFCLVIVLEEKNIEIIQIRLLTLLRGRKKKNAGVFILQVP